jgi:DhnA family fructose-bisphosphate aldolase class Ia
MAVSCGLLRTRGGASGRSTETIRCMRTQMYNKGAKGIAMEFKKDYNWDNTTQI